MGKNDEMLFKAEKLRSLNKRVVGREGGWISPAKQQRLKLALLAEIRGKVQPFGW